MPLSVGVAVQPPQPPQPAQPAPTVGTLRATWLAPDGTVWSLCDRSLPWITLATWSSVTGAAPIQLTTDDHPRGGARIRHIQPMPRVMIWPVRVSAPTHLEFVAAVRQIAGAFTQTRRLGPGTIRISRPDGTSREIEAHYEAGISGEPGQSVVRDLFAMSLFCEDPYWRDVTPTVVARAFSAPLNYYDPYASISSGQVLGETTIANDGDVEAWPSWTITGPMTQLAATNHTTGEAFVLDATLLASQVATITTDPPSVRGPGGVNWSGMLDWPDAVLWGLVPGANDVDFAVAGAAAGTRIELSYKRRYETP